MSSVTSEYCGDDISEDACSGDGYEYEGETHEYDGESYEGYDGPYEHGEGTHEYEGESYEGYDGPYEHERHGGENYYSGDDCEMNGAYGSCDDVEGVEEPCSEYYSEDEGYEESHSTHHDHGGNVRYNGFLHMSCEPLKEEYDRKESGEVEFSSSSCATSSLKQEGIDVWWSPIRSRRVDHRRSTFPTTRNHMPSTSYPNPNVSCSRNGNSVGGRMGGTQIQSSRRNPRPMFEANVSVYGSAGFVLAFDDRAHANFITPHAVEWLGLSWMVRQDPYPDRDGYWVDKSVKVTFSLGEYQEEVWCDVLPMDACQIRLGIPWFQSHKIPPVQTWYNFIWDHNGNPFFPPSPPIEVNSSVPLGHVESMVVPTERLDEGCQKWQESFNEVRRELQRTSDICFQMFAKLRLKELQGKMKAPCKNVMKEPPLEATQVEICEVGTKELNMEVETSTPYATKWKLELKGSSNPSQGILGTCPNSDEIERKKIERSKGVICDNSRVEKGEVVCSDESGLSQPSTNFSSFSSCFDTCAGVLGSKPNEEPQNMENHEAFESFSKEQELSKIDDQGKEDSSCVLEE